MHCNSRKREEAIVRMAAGESGAAVARDLGVTTSTTCLWYREACEGDRDPLEALDMCQPQIGRCTVDEPVTYFTCDRCTWEGILQQVGKAPTMRCPGCGRLIRPRKRTLKQMLEEEFGL